MFQGWGVAVLVGVAHKDAEFKTNPINFLTERTLKGTFFGNYRPRTDLPAVVEKYMTGVCYLCISFHKLISCVRFFNLHLSMGFYPAGT
jgi:Zn-dependent alcohol dehydrogenase